MESKCVYLGLGGNLGNALFRLQLAFSLLHSKKDSVSQLKISHYYRTAPQYYESPHWYVNAACSFWTSLSLQEVFDMTKTIESQLGKVNKAKNADRPIDIDLLFYGKEFCRDPELEIPHPRWKERLFVLVPLADLIDEIHLEEGNLVERYLIKDLIQPLMENSGQSISLLEKNPQLQ